MPRKENVDLFELCMNVIARLKADIQAQGQRFRLSALPEEADFLVFADKQQIETIFNNLLSNAIKYGRKQSMVDVQLTKEKHTVRFTVSNETNTAIENPSQLGNQFCREGFLQERLWSRALDCKALAGKERRMYNFHIPRMPVCSKCIF